MPETKLKPCPFCGCRDVRTTLNGLSIVACCENSDCKASLRAEIRDQELIHTPAIYIIAEKWNRRAGE